MAVGPPDPIRLRERDRFAFEFRIAGTLIGTAVIAVAFATSSCENRWRVCLSG
jgi:hypothetical protein